MRERRGRDRVEDLCSGPGKLTEALGVGLELNGADLLDAAVRDRAARGRVGRGSRSSTGPRIGITKAVELPWRYCAAGNRLRLEALAAGSRSGGLEPRAPVPPVPPVAPPPPPPPPEGAGAGAPPAPPPPPPEPPPPLAPERRRSCGT